VGLALINGWAMFLGARNNVRALASCKVGQADCLHKTFVFQLFHHTPCLGEVRSSIKTEPFWLAISYRKENKRKAMHFLKNDYL
jgi:hypothetical protein